MKILYVDVNTVGYHLYYLKTLVNKSKHEAVVLEPDGAQILDIGGKVFQ